MMAAREALDGLGQVLQQMPAIGYLYCVWSSLASSIGVGSGSVPANDLDAGMLLEPSDKRLGSAIGEQVYGAMPLQVHEDRPVSLCTAQGEVVDAQYPGRRVCRDRRSSNIAKQGRWTGRHAQTIHQPGSGLSTHGEAHQPKDFV